MANGFNNLGSGVYNTSGQSQTGNRLRLFRDPEDQSVMKLSEKMGFKLGLQPVDQTEAPTSMAPTAPANQQGQAGLPTPPEAPEPQMFDTDKYQEQFQQIAQQKQKEGQLKSEVIGEVRQQESTVEQQLQDRLKLLREGTVIETEDGEAVEIPGINDLEQKLVSQRQKMKDQELDPNKFYNEMSTGNKILAAISMGLGAWGQAMTGAPNQAINILQQAVQNDIEAQKINMKKVQDEYKLTRQDLKDKQTRIKLERAEASEQKARLYKDAQLRLQEITERGIDPELQQRALEFQAQLEQLNQQALQQAHQRKMDVFSSKFDLTKFEEQKRQFGEQMNFKRAEFVKQQLQKGEETRVPGLKKLEGYTPNKKNAETAAEMYSTYQKIKDDIVEYNQLIKQHGGAEVLPTEARDLLKAKRSQVVRGISKLEGMGANFTGNEERLINDQIPDVTSLVAGARSNLLDWDARKATRQTLDAIHRATSEQLRTQKYVLEEPKYISADVLQTVAQKQGISEDKARTAFERKGYVVAP